MKVLGQQVEAAGVLAKCRPLPLSEITAVAGSG